MDSVLSLLFAQPPEATGKKNKPQNDGGAKLRKLSKLKLCLEKGGRDVEETTGWRQVRICQHKCHGELCPGSVKPLKGTLTFRECS